MKYFVKDVSTVKLRVKTLISDSKHGPVGAAIDMIFFVINVTCKICWHSSRSLRFNILHSGGLKKN